MASPQTENGYTKIANELLEQIVATPLPDNEHRMLLFIIRKTYGYNKKEDRISLTQFEKALKRSRPVVSKTLKNLKARNIVVATPLLTLKFNKDWETWVVDTPLLVKNKKHPSSYAPTETGSPAPTHKRKKENNTKENTAAKPLNEINLIINIFQTINPGINYANLTNRKAAEWLINKYGYEKASSTAEYAVMSTGKPYAPTITTPYQLKEKLGSLIAFYKRDYKETFDKTSKHLKL